jgi:hypothetical protein
VLRHHLEVAHLGVGVGTAVCLDQADDHVNALAAEGVRIFEHRVALADPGRGADVNAQPRAVDRLNPREQLIARRPLPGLHASILGVLLADAAALTKSLRSLERSLMAPAPIVKT